MRTNCPLAKTAMPKRSPASSTLYVILCGTLLLSCGLAVVAQSGRRVRKPAPLPIPTPEATSTPTTSSEKPKLAITFIVGLDKYGDSSRISLNAYSGVLRNCTDRLGDSLSVKAEVSTHDMSRSDAVRQAKAEKEAYIVWLQLRPNTFTGQTGVYDDSNNVYIEYSVFAPATAKLATSGNTYPEAYRNKRVRVPTSSTNGDYYLNQAARGAAERILDHFHLRLPNTLP
jgi:hypothetical protein